MKKYILGTYLFLIASIAYAAQELPPQEIEWIGTGWASEGIYFKTKEQISAEGCANTTLRFNSDHPLKQEMISITLAAFHSGTKIRFYVDGCENGNMLVKAVKSVK